MRILAPMLILLLSTSLGCPIMDELNKAKAQMDEYAKVKPEEETDLASEAGNQGNALLRR